MKKLLIIIGSIASIIIILVLIVYVYLNTEQNKAHNLVNRELYGNFIDIKQNNEQIDRQVVGELRKALIYLNDYYKQNKVYPADGEFEQEYLAKYGLNRQLIQYYSDDAFGAGLKGVQTLSRTNRFYITYKLNSLRDFAIGQFENKQGSYFIYKVTNVNYVEFLN